MVVLLVTWTLVAITPPNCTVAPVKKFWPEMVTAVPPSVDPEVGLRERTEGAEALISMIDATEGTPLPLRIKSMYCPGAANVGPKGAVTFRPPEAWLKLS